MDKVKVKNETGLVRDLKSNAILSTDNKGLQAYKARKRQAQKTTEIYEDVADLKNKMINIEKLLVQILERDNK